MANWLRNSSWLKLVLLFATCVVITSLFHSGKKINGVIWSDQEGYYIYLPAVFIYGGFENVPCVNGCTTVERNGSNYTFTKYTYGVSLMEAPFFAIAHLISKPLGYAGDGRSLPYIWAVMLAAICYMLAGLVLLHRLLKELEFGQLVSVMVPVGLLLGTNLFYYTFREAGMSHVYSFFLFTVLIYASHKRTISKKLIWTFLTAFPLALVVLIRPTNAIAGLIPLLWAADFRDIPTRLKAFLTDWKWLLIFGVSLLVLFAPQVYYWQYLTGEYFLYSYGNEGFTNWNQPKVLQVLLSHQNGWITYSPIVLIGLAGLWQMIRRRITGWQMPTVTLVLATYIFASWWAWWFGGAYGHRCYVDFLPLLAVPSAFAVKAIIESKMIYKAAIIGFALITSFVNIRMSDLYHGMWDGPNWTWHNYIDKLLQAFYIF